MKQLRKVRAKPNAPEARQMSSPCFTYVFREAVLFLSVHPLLLLSVVRLCVIMMTFWSTGTRSLLLHRWQVPVNKGLPYALGGLERVLQRAASTLLSAVLHASFRAVMPDKSFIDILFLILFSRAFSSSALHCSPSINSGFGGGGSRARLTTTGHRKLHRTGSSQ